MPQCEIVFTSSSAGKVKKQRVAIKLQVPGGAWGPKNVTCSTSTDWLTNWAKTRQDDPREHQFFNRQALYSNTVKGERYDFWKVLSAIRGQRDAGIWWEVEIGKTVETYQRRHSHKDNSFCFQQQRQGDWPRPCECLCGKRSFKIWYSHVNIHGSIYNTVDITQPVLPNVNNDHSLTCANMQHKMDQFTTQ